MLQLRERDATTPGLMACLPETRIGLFDSSVTTSTEPLGYVSGSSHRASVDSWCEVVSDLVLFTQEDSVPRAGRAHLYGYVDNEPVAYRDPLGLFKVDFDSCERGGSPLNVRRAIAGACSYLKKKPCQDALASRKGMAAGGGMMDMFSCMQSRCDAREGSGVTIKCSCSTSGCGETKGMEITLMLGGPGAGCPRYQLNQATGESSGPRDFGQTLFHELMHTCGFPGEGDLSTPMLGVYDSIIKVCTGWGH